jgi:DNA-binding HxlR family transcriptional regulator
MATQPDATGEREDEVEQLNADVCTVVGSIEAVGSKWTLILINDLLDGEKRFNELKRSTGASSYTLSRVLDDLQEEGFVNKRMEMDAPVASYYSLTEKGEALCPVFDALDEWGGEWLDHSE